MRATDGKFLRKYGGMKMKQRIKKLTRILACLIAVSLIISSSAMTSYAANDDCEHTYDIQEASEGATTTTGTCSKCGDTKEITIPTEIKYVNFNYDGRSCHNFAPIIKVGDNIEISVGVLPEDADNKEIVVEASDPSAIEYESTSDLRGILTLKKIGTIKIKVYPKYNPSAKREYKIEVCNDKEHNFVVKIPSEVQSETTQQCIGCGKVENTTVITEITDVLWIERDLSTSHTPKSYEVGDEVKLTVYSAPKNAKNVEFEVEISDPSKVSFEKTGNTNGIIKALAAGPVDVAIYPKYNPSAKKEYSFFVVEAGGHTFEYTPVKEGDDNQSTKKCTGCGYEEAYTAFYKIDLYGLTENSQSGESSSELLSKTYDVGETLDIVYYGYSSTAEDEEVLVISDLSEVVDYAPQENKTQYSDAKVGTLTMLKEGTFTITAYAKHNPSVKKTVTINIAHNYEEELFEKANCVTTEKIKHTCTGCGHFYIEEKELGEHDAISIINAKTPTKNQEGYTGDKYCETCKTILEYGKVIDKIEDNEEDTPVKDLPAVKVSYRTHIQSFGWEGTKEDVNSWKNNGEMSGTSGLAKRLEGINIVVNSTNPDKKIDLGIQYTTHCQSYGWLPWSANGDMSGTEGEAKRLEAIKIQLTGADAQYYDVYYRVHAQSFGWLRWAKNGAPAGTAGYGKRLEGIQVVVVKKGTNIDENMKGIKSNHTDAYVAASGSSPIVNYPSTSNQEPIIPGEGTPNVTYRTHVQSFGWQGWKYNGQMSGTSGLAKRLEGIEINLTNAEYDGDIVYCTHVQTYAWQGADLKNPSTWKKNGAMAGTSGEAKRLEAICIALTGEMAEHYDIYYRVHAQTFGWLGWAKNGEASGTAGYAKRLEGIQIVLVPKGKAAPSVDYGGIVSTNPNCYIEK